VTEASKKPLARRPRGDFGPQQGEHLAWSAWEMFVAGEVLLDLSFPAEEARLANLARGRSLTRASQGAYGDGLTGLVRVGPLGAAPGMSKLVEVHFLKVVTRGESAVLALRWEATGLGGRPFPVLDADMSLTPAGEHSTRLSLAGVYRPPLAALGAGLDRAVFHRVADATVQSLLARVAGVLARPQAPAGARAANRHDRGRRAPGSGPNVLARLRSGGRIRLMVIERDVPDIPDRQVQLADGFADLPGSRMIADQSQCRFESEPRGEQPSYHEVVHALGDAVAVLHQEKSRLRPVACPPGRGITRRPYARLV
jgi:hypothetical protein